jgi:hypothetical protein
LFALGSELRMRIPARFLVLIISKRLGSLTSPAMASYASSRSVSTFCESLSTIISSLSSSLSSLANANPKLPLPRIRYVGLILVLSVALISFATLLIE